MARKFFTKGQLGTGELQIVWSNAELGDEWRRITKKEALAIAKAQHKAYVFHLHHGGHTSDMLMERSYPDPKSVFIVPEGYEIQKDGEHLKLWREMADGSVVYGDREKTHKPAVLTTVGLVHAYSGEECTCTVKDGYLIEF